MKIKIFIALLGIVGQVSLYSQPVTIEGKADFAKGKHLRLYFYNDLYLQQKSHIATVPVGKDGLFKAQIPVRETRRVFIAFNETYGSFFVEPQQSYQIELHADSMTLPYLEAELMGSCLYIKFLNGDSTELNRKIRRFDAYHNRFCELYLGRSFLVLSAVEYDSLIHILFNYCPFDSSAIDFYSVYAKYRYGAIEMFYRHRDRRFLYQKYLNNEYVFYQNDAYMEFFNDFFENYLYAGSNRVMHQILFENINKKADCFQLLNDLGKDPLLINERIREMALIKGLGELYENHDEFDHEHILRVLHWLRETTKFEEHKTFINNMVKNFFSLKPTTPAPEFTLKDAYNAKVSLSDFKGKYVYIQFFSTHNEETIREMIILKSLHEKYSDNVQFISVMTDFEPVKLYHFVSLYKQFDWIFVSIQDNHSFLDDYRAKALPLGVLIDPAGKIVEYPATPASKGLVTKFFNIFGEPNTEPRK